jgi:hypothetical protein
VVLFAIPLSFGALALALTNNTLNIFTILGVVYVIGLVCKNAIMLCGLHQSAKGEEHKNRIQESRTSSSNFDDNHCDGIWYVPNCIGIGCWCRMEKRFGLGNYGGLIVHLF